MKKTAVISLIMVLLMLLLPLGALGKETATPVKETAALVKEPSEETFKVLLNNGKIEELKAEDYILGVVSAEMPALYEEEALKAQAVAAYTYTLCKQKQNKTEEYDITADYTKDQSYITAEEAKTKWGDKAEEYTEKIKKAVKEVKNYVITYNGEPINAVYHAISGGKTESCEDVWGKDLPYLKSVLSEWDKLGKNYATSATFSAQDLKTKFPETEFSGEESSYFNSIKRTNAGRIKEICLCDKTLSGEDVRSALDLRSANFTVEYKDGNFVFTVYGYGHGVGMSQNGANEMAKQGSDFKEILKYYYTGCKIEKT